MCEAVSESRTTTIPWEGDCAKCQEEDDREAWGFSEEQKARKLCLKLDREQERAEHEASASGGMLIIQEDADKDDTHFQVTNPNPLWDTTDPIVDDKEREASDYYNDDTTAPADEHHPSSWKRDPLSKPPFYPPPRDACQATHSDREAAKAEKRAEQETRWRQGRLAHEATLKRRADRKARLLANKEGGGKDVGKWNLDKQVVIAPKGGGVGLSVRSKGEGDKGKGKGKEKETEREREREEDKGKNEYGKRVVGSGFDCGDGSLKMQKFSY